MTDVDRIEQARVLYEAAAFGGDIDALAIADRELDRVEAELALARGRIVHGRFLAEQREDPEELQLFERAVELFHALGDTRGEGEALFWVGVFHQVVRRDGDRSRPFLERSRKLAEQVGDKMTISYAVRHLGFAEMYGGQPDVARQLFEESVRLREELGFVPGVAAGKLALADLAASLGERDEALRLLDEAAALAEASGARGTAHWIEQSRAELS